MGSDTDIRLLGRVEVLIGSQVLEIPRRQERCLLALLALDPGKPVSADRLVSLLWDDDAPAGARATVHSYISRLRRTLAPLGDIVFHRDGGYVLDIDPDRVDAHRFRVKVQQARLATSPHDRATLLTEALDLWRGSFLDTAATDRLLQRVGAEWLEMRAAALDARIDADLLCGRHQQLIGELLTLVDEDPASTARTTQLMLALYRSGRQVDALNAYQSLRDRLASEMGLDPDPQAEQLQQAILRRDPSLELTAHDSPGCGQLPGDIAEFIGRSKEVDAIVGLLTGHHPPSAMRAVVIEGMAGVGKTRLAVHVAHRLARTGRFPDGQFAIDLRGFHQDSAPEAPVAALGELLRMMGVAAADVPSGLDARAAMYRQRLANSRMLVLLDNAMGDEQVIPLLPSGSGSAVVITSRRSLALDGVRRMPLAPFTDEEAQQLFARITGRQESSLELIGLCGHLPLAVALVAHRLVNRPQWKIGRLVDRLRQENQRLDEMSAGTRRVQSVFLTSYRGLTPAHQRAFRLLGKHPGRGFSSLSAAVLLGLDRRVTESLLETLVDEHLLMSSRDDRYQFHDLIRAFATERADVDGIDSLSMQRLVQWYLSAAYNAAGTIARHTGIIALPEEMSAPGTPVFADEESGQQWLTEERSAIMDSVRIAYEHGCDQVAWRLPVALLGWDASASTASGWTAAIETALEAARRCGHRQGEAQVLRMMGFNHRDQDQAMRLLLEAKEISATIDDRYGEGLALNNLGVVYGRAGQFGLAASMFGDALTIQRSLGGPQTLRVLNNLGRTYNGLGEFEKAFQCFDEALTGYRAIDDQAGLASTMDNHAEALMNAGRPADAIALFSAACAIYQAKQEDSLMVGSAIGLGDALKSAGRLDEAHTQWQAVLSIAESLGLPAAEKIRGRLR